MLEHRLQVFQQVWNLKSEWFRQCVETIQQKHLHSNTASRDVLVHVLAEMLHHDISVTCNDLQQRMNQKIMDMHGLQIKGYWILQIDVITNIGEASESRLKDSNTRMLKFLFTDGKQLVVGIEYKPIKKISQSTPRGTKVLLHDVFVRRGILFLVPECIMVLGTSEPVVLQPSNSVKTNESTRVAVASSKPSTADVISHQPRATHTNQSKHNEPMLLGRIEEKSHAPSSNRQAQHRGMGSVPRPLATETVVIDSSTSSSSSPSSSEEDHDTDPAIHHLFHSTPPNRRRSKPSMSSHLEKHVVHSLSPSAVHATSAEARAGVEAEAEVTVVKSQPFKKARLSVDLNPLASSLSGAPSNITQVEARNTTIQPSQTIPPRRPIPSSREDFECSDLTSASHAKQAPESSSLFVYLRDLQQSIEDEQPLWHTTQRIKGFVKTLAGFNFSMGYYELKLILEDGTAGLKVMVDPQYVEKLMGVPCQEFVQQLSSNSPQAHQWVEAMQLTLRHMQGIMLIKFNKSSNVTPILLECKPMERREGYNLLCRVQAQLLSW